VKEWKLDTDKNKEGRQTTKKKNKQPQKEKETTRKGSKAARL